jgi:hypothetical protein
MNNLFIDRFLLIAFHESWRRLAVSNIEIKLNISIKIEVKLPEAGDKVLRFKQVFEVNL